MRRDGEVSHGLPDARQAALLNGPPLPLPPHPQRLLLLLLLPCTAPPPIPHRGTRCLGFLGRRRWQRCSHRARMLLLLLRGGMRAWRNHLLTPSLVCRTHRVCLCCSGRVAACTSGSGSGSGCTYRLCCGGSSSSGSERQRMLALPLRLASLTTCREESRGQGEAAGVGGG